MASLFAARSRVWIQSSSLPRRLQPPCQQLAALSEKKTWPDSAHGCRHRRRSPRRSLRACSLHQTPPDAAARQPLSMLPQWSYGRQRDLPAHVGDLWAARVAGRAHRREPVRRVAPRGGPRRSKIGQQPAQADRQRTRGDRGPGREVLGRRSKACCCCCPRPSCSPRPGPRSCPWPRTRCSGAGRSRWGSWCCCSSTRWAT